MSDNPIYIAVFGRTGSGKTSFINRATGASINPGHGAASDTKIVEQVNIPSNKVEGREIILIDTPGFNDTDLEEPRLFLHIADWLANSHYNGERLNGVVFLQGINEVRVLKGEQNGVELFKNIVGSDALGQVMVVTTMWDQVEPDFGTRNENNRASVWLNLKSGGARFGRFYNTEDSALEIVREFQEFPKITLLLQQELIQHGGKVRKTSAAQFLEKSLGVKIADIRKQVKIVSASGVLKSRIRELRNWLKELIKASIKFGALTWKPVAATGMAMRIWDTQ
ncbi:hypothetical protein O1611_g8013 [Lasiodiplodia mahajangana]|uniref:Uncharacterized protein n=1 Tax=Lasiodiplodia mahajangana TaxID=1108764 RepID=A0ACC2JE31_9PEZI|nr:hypothetical protein O1611_g8013 [Lasiodiplodia mahajangana]